ncbi:GNAT family N-acetyltransferase [Microbacterium sp.]|uniref:GNAT family N-acetyltransferase n=1 Tax=Microbacterium sp. TaxID=51671 RepID=UPI0028125DB4|nr:GNAT family N-acetyltransferase [Microbacterium sp.]
MTIRRAVAGEAEAISDLALRSKAHWGYSAEFLEMCRAELTYTPERCGSPGMWVAAQGDELLGFYLIETPTHETAPLEGELAALFVAPERIGAGLGGRLLRHALTQAEASGIQRLTLDADPGAEPFYRHHGARRIGQTPSGSIPGRTLPRMAFDLHERDSHEHDGEERITSR